MRIGCFRGILSNNSIIASGIRSIQALGLAELWKIPRTALEKMNDSDTCFTKSERIGSLSECPPPHFIGKPNFRTVVGRHRTPASVRIDKKDHSPLTMFSSLTGHRWTNVHHPESNQREAEFRAESDSTEAPPYLRILTFEFFGRSCDSSIAFIRPEICNFQNREERWRGFAEHFQRLCAGEPAVIAPRGATLYFRPASRAFRSRYPETLVRIFVVLAHLFRRIDVDFPCASNPSRRANSSITGRDFSTAALSIFTILVRRWN